jgi:hypothetical protein
LFADCTLQYDGYSGGNGGSEFQDDNIPCDARVLQVKVWNGEFIDGVQFVYRSKDGHTQNTPIHGGTGGHLTELNLNEGESIITIQGRSGDYVDSMTLTTDRGRQASFGGGGGSNTYIYQAPQGYEIVGVAGRSRETDRQDRRGNMYYRVTGQSESLRN